MRTLLVLTTLWSSSLTGKWCLIVEQCYNECLCFKYMTDHSKCITNVGSLFYRDNYWMPKSVTGKVLILGGDIEVPDNISAGNREHYGPVVLVLLVRVSPWSGQRSVSRSSQLLTTPHRPHQTSPTRFLLPQPRATGHTNTTVTALAPVKHRAVLTGAFKCQIIMSTEATLRGIRT